MPVEIRCDKCGTLLLDHAEEGAIFVEPCQECINSLSDTPQESDHESE